jgi:cytochrome c-type biogenesis protein CcmH/NrfF
MCGCGRQTLAECTCGFAAKERSFIANLIDQGKLREEIVKALISRYPGESALVVPVDTGFNRLAWLIPVLALVGTAAGLSILARRWRDNQRLVDAAEKTSQASAADKTKDPKADQKYIDRLDDDLDDLN